MCYGGSVRSVKYVRPRSLHEGVTMYEITFNERLGLWAARWAGVQVGLYATFDAARLALLAIED